ncbi:hypothetical protein N9383_01470 [Granulosicoccus sp.]|nr:hypothetical protein [Granulosicoccus sp.]
MQMRIMMTTFRIPDWQTHMALLIDPDTVSIKKALTRRALFLNWNFISGTYRYAPGES